MRILFIIAATCLGTSLAFSAENLLTNGGFENGDAGWRLWQQFPGTAKGEPSGESAHTGRFAFKIVNQGKGGANLYSDDIPCEPQSTYTITVWARTEDAKRTAISIWGLDADGKTLAHSIGRSTPVPDSLARFMRFSREVTTPENCTKIRAHLVNNGGAVWWDSAEIRKGPLFIGSVVPEPAAPEGSKNMVPNSGFEEQKLGWRFWQKFPGDADDVLDTEVKHSGNCSYRIANKDKGGANVFSDDIPCQPNTTYTISAYVRTDNARGCHLAGWTLDKDGKVLSYDADGGVDIPANLDEFKRFVHTFKTPENCRAIRAHLIQNGGVVWWDGVQIEKGDAATEYRPGLSILASLAVGRAEAIKYTNAIIRHAQIGDLCEQARRAAAYAMSGGNTVDAALRKIDSAEQQLSTLDDVLQIDRIAPDFMKLNYDKANTALDAAESDAKTALGGLIAVLGEAKALPPPPAKPEGVITPEKLASRLYIFPLLAMGKCGTAFFDGTYDWSMLKPFGFDAISPGVYAQEVRGEYDFTKADERIQSTAALGLLADIQVDVAHEIRRRLFDRYGEEIYLHAADGRWSESGDCHQVINIWQPEVRRVNNEYLEAFGRNFRDNPNVLCYELINEPSLHIEKWAERFRSEPIGPGGYSKAARAAWLRYLQGEYKAIDQLNTRWGSQYRSFESVEPPADLNAEPPTSLPYPGIPLAIEFNRFRMQSHNEYFRESVAALRRGDPNRAIMPQFIAATGPRVEAADDLLGLSLAGWDIFSTHDWPGDNPAVTCLYAYSINRYVRLPMWEDEFIFSHWVQKGVDPRLARPAIERNLWRQIAWGKRGIHLFNLEEEWRAGFPDNWNNSILNIEAASKIVRFETGAIKVVKDRGERVAPILFDTEIEHQGIAILQPTSALYSGAVRRQSSHDSNRICTWLLSRHWTPFFVPEECIIDGRENMSDLKLIIAPMAVCAAKGLEGKLIDWVKAGGVLVISGPFGVYDDEGRRSMALMSELAGVADAAFSEGKWEIKLADGRRLAPDEVVSVTVDKGKVWLIPGQITRRDNEDMLPPAQILSDAFPAQPIRCDNEKVELILRRAANGNKYVCAVNLDYGAPIKTEINLTGEFPNAVDLTIGDGLRVPVQMADGMTSIPIRLSPGGAAILRLTK